MYDELKSIKDYIKQKYFFEKRNRIYEELVPFLSNKLGFKYFKLVLLHQNKPAKISREDQIDYFLNIFFDHTHSYSIESRIVFYKMAQMVYTLEKKRWKIFWDTLMEIPDTDIGSSIDLISENNTEFKKIVQGKTKNWHEYQSILEKFPDSGYIIVHAFQLIEANAVNRNYLPSFCLALDEYISFTENIELYYCRTSGTDDWEAEKRKAFQILSNEAKESEILMNKIENILPLLKPRDIDVVKTCFGIGRNDCLGVIEAAEKFGLKTNQVNQILRTTLKKMRNYKK